MIPAWLYRLVRAGLAAGLIILVLAAALYFCMVLRAQWLAGADRLSPAYHSMPEADFSNLWVAGRLVRHGGLATLYSASGFEAARQSLFGRGIERLDWIYPPGILLLAVPFSLPPLLTAYAFWLAFVFGGGCLALRAAGLPWRVILPGLLGPATWRAYQLGQVVPLTGALLFAGLLLASRRPRLAGAMLGLVTLKPQIGLLAPVALLASRAWVALAVAAAMVLALAALTAALFGPLSWRLYFSEAAGHTRWILQAMFPRGAPSFAGSVFWTARAWGMSLPAAYAIQAGAAGAAAVVTWRLRRRLRADGEARAIIVSCLSLLASPYLFASDYVAYSLALALLALRRPEWSLPLGLLWVWPGLSDAAGLLGARPILPLCVTLAAWLASRKPPLRAVAAG